VTKGGLEMEWFADFITLGTTKSPAPSYPLEPPTMKFDPPIFHPNGEFRS
jgi:hypothetical protein